MIDRVNLRYFKMFKEQSFDTSGNIVLAGQNNMGKTTLLQAIAAWNLALRKWLAERGPESGSKARTSTGVPITRTDFTAIPLREMNLLWTDCSTALKKGEVRGDQKPGFPRILEIKLDGDAEGKDYSVSFEFRCQSLELLYAKPSLQTQITPDLPALEELKRLQVVHVPPFSGIEVNEVLKERNLQEFLIGQGKPGDILRNLLFELYRDKPTDWESLRRDIEEIFGYELLPPVYAGRPFILCEYKPGIPSKERKTYRRLDISSAGSGFLQVLMLLAFFYARPASTLLLDEPDAHLHIYLQKQVYDRLQHISRMQGCQLIIATHSEVLIDSTSPERILSFYQGPNREGPHRLQSETERDQVRETLRCLTSLDILRAEQSPGILYLEDETSLNLLREWARVLNHPAYDFLSRNPFWHNNQGRHPREARQHFFALKALKPSIRGVLLLDGDNRSLPEHELVAEGLELVRWERYEAESYLIHPEALARFVRGPKPNIFTSDQAVKGLNYLKDQLPPAVFRDPLKTHEYLISAPASKTLLPGFFGAAEFDITRKEYYQIASQMEKDEIPEEVGMKLDRISEMDSGSR